MAARVGGTRNTMAAGTGDAPNSRASVRLRGGIDFRAGVSAGGGVG